ncbi:MAG: hypothetical protein GYB64_13885 [Chloroflexi bacterium]|nr:hypothetical protein [Chloroflexota bacterium]
MEELHTNLATEQRFRRESWWQIVFPVVFTSVLMIAVTIVIIALGGVQGLSAAADYAFVFLFFVFAVLAVTTAAAFIGLAYAFIRLILVIPPYAFKAQLFMKQVYEKTDEATDKVAQQVIAVRSRAAGVDALRNHLDPDTDNTTLEEIKVNGRGTELKTS